MKYPVKVLLALFIAAFPLQVYAAPFTVTFTDLNPKMMGGDVFGAGGNNDVAFEVTNQTGSTWNDFHMQVALGPAGTLGIAFYVPAALAGTFGTDGFPYEGPGSFTLSNLNNQPAYPDVLDVVGLNVPTGGTYSFSVDIAAGESGWIMAGYPTVGTPPPPLGNPPQVPEPGTALLFGMGLLVGGAFRRLGLRR
jgi:PEP-CTERM motif